MIRGIGVDIIEIERIKKAMDRYGKFETRIFTGTEREYCRSCSQPACHFAVRFAAKEAVSKALGNGKRGIRWTDIEIVKDVRGKPRVRLSGNAAKLAAENGVGDIAVSLSFNKQSAVATAIAIGSTDRLQS